MTGVVDMFSFFLPFYSLFLKFLISYIDYPYTETTTTEPLQQTATTRRAGTRERGAAATATAATAAAAATAATARASPHPSLVVQSALTQQWCPSTRYPQSDCSISGR
jgi:hypothetical protein